LLALHVGDVGSGSAELSAEVVVSIGIIDYG